MRNGSGFPAGRKSESPCPRRLSAPFMSRMTRESIRLATWNAIRDGKVAVAITGLGSAPVRASRFEELLNGGGSLDDAAREAGAGTEPIDDLDGSAEYKRHLAGVLAKRAVEAARAR